MHAFRWFRRILAHRDAGGGSRPLHQQRTKEHVGCTAGGTEKGAFGCHRPRGQILGQLTRPGPPFLRQLLGLGDLFGSHL